MPRFRTFVLGLPLVLAMMLGAPRQAPLEAEGAGQPGFDGYVQVLAARARRAGVREATIAGMTQGLVPDPRVIALDRAQPGAGAGAPLSFAAYLRDHVDAGRIAGGRAMLREIGPGFAQRIEREYGVPAAVVVAIWGHETNYGRYQGGFDLARSLATLAWEGRRRELFADEFVALLRMADRGVPRARLAGSWAGAMGNPQFLPSTYLRLARDGDGDGDADIWNDRADTLASIANYFRDAGWRAGEPWGTPATVPPELDTARLVTRLAAPVCQRVHGRESLWKTVAEWRALGVRPAGDLGERTLATLIEPDGHGGAAWLLTGNYRVILHYNCSNYYALSVGSLADEIAR